MGKKIYKYELGKILGTGSFAAVHQCVDIETGSQHAIKVIEKSKLPKDTMLKREIAIMKHLQHPNIVPLIEVMQTQRNYYIVMGLVAGGNLLDKLQATKQGLSEPQARKYFHQLLAGLYHCHLHGIAHRDLKPENLLVDHKADTIKLTDFGLSNRAENKMLNTVCGSPNYMAPEVLQSQQKGYDGFCSDMWSCGVILYEMLTGILPFDSPHLEKLYTMIEKGEYDSPTGISPQAKDLITRLLVTDPTARATMKDVIAHPWFQQDFNPALFEVPEAFNPSKEQTEQAVRDENES